MTREFLLSALQNGLRPDGREFSEYRAIKIHFGDQHGQAEVTIGSSRALCTVEGEIEKPFEARPSEGFLQFNVDFGFVTAGHQSIGGSADTQGRAKFTSLDDALELALIVEKLLVGSRAIDKESLCIAAGVKVWSLRCDIRVLDNDGNLRDLCALAALAGILHYRRQEVRVEGDTAKVLLVDESDLAPLSVHHIPVLVTLAFFDKTDSFVVDPTAMEEEVMSSRFSVGVNQHGEICGIHKPGGRPVNFDVMQYAIQVASQRAAEATQALKDSMEAERLKRKQAQKFVCKRPGPPPLTVPVQKFAGGVTKISGSVKQQDEVVEQKLIDLVRELEAEGDVTEVEFNVVESREEVPNTPPSKKPFEDIWRSEIENGTAESSNLSSGVVDAREEIVADSTSAAGMDADIDFKEEDDGELATTMQMTDATDQAFNAPPENHSNIHQAQTYRSEGIQPQDSVLLPTYDAGAGGDDLLDISAAVKVKKKRKSKSRK